MVTRVGILDKWEKGFKRHSKSLLPVQSQIDLTFDELKEYVQSGDFASSPFKDKPSVNPAWSKWEQSRLYSGLAFFSRINVQAEEFNALNGMAYGSDHLGPVNTNYDKICAWKFQKHNSKSSNICCQYNEAM